MSDIVQDLRNVAERHKDKQVGVGEIRIDYLATDVARAIEELRAENAALKSRLEEAERETSTLLRVLDMTDVIYARTTTT